MEGSKINFNFFVLLLVLVTIGFLAVILPLYGAIFWAVIFAVIFYPVNEWLLRKLPNKRNTAALITLVLCILLGIIPLLIVTGALVQEAITLYQAISSGKINFAQYGRQMFDGAPDSVKYVLDYFNLNDLDDLQNKLQSAITQGTKMIANRAIAFGSDTFQFIVSLGIMIYLLFFFFRDGKRIVAGIKNAIPLKPNYRNLLFDKVASVVKATVKGNILIAVVQGILGGIIFYILGIQGALLWGFMMGLLSLLPAIGAAIVWFPVSVYFFAVGNVTNGAILMAYGLLVIGMSDNFLRPIFVGKSTRLPDYIILTTTLGGLTVFGPNGFVIGPLAAALFIACWQIFAETVSEKVH